MIINTIHDIKQRVYIKELQIWGVVLAIHMNNSLKYLVRYFDDKDAKECYFYEEELSLQENENRVGF